MVVQGGTGRVGGHEKGHSPPSLADTNIHTTLSPMPLTSFSLPPRPDQPIPLPASHPDIPHPLPPPSLPQYTRACVSLFLLPTIRRRQRHLWDPGIARLALPRVFEMSRKEENRTSPHIPRPIFSFQQYQVLSAVLRFWLGGGRCRPTSKFRHFCQIFAKIIRAPCEFLALGGKLSMTRRHWLSVWIVLVLTSVTKL